MSTPQAPPKSKARQVFTRGLFAASLALLGWNLYELFGGLGATRAATNNVIIAAALVLLNVDAVVKSKNVKNVSAMLALGLVIAHVIRRFQGG